MNFILRFQNDFIGNTRIRIFVSEKKLDDSQGDLSFSFSYVLMKLPWKVSKVYCKVDADYAPAEIGDLLTTSATPGHAMKATDPFKAFGTVIGKAMHPLKEGKGLIPILVALQ